MIVFIFLCFFFCVCLFVFCFFPLLKTLPTHHHHTTTTKPQKNKKLNREIERLIRRSPQFAGVGVHGNEKAPRSGAFEVVVNTEDGKEVTIFSKLDTGSFPNTDMVVPGMFYRAMFFSI